MWELLHLLGLYILSTSYFVTLIVRYEDVSQIGFAALYYLHFKIPGFLLIAFYLVSATGASLVLVLAV